MQPKPRRHGSRAVGAAFLGTALLLLSGTGCALKRDLDLTVDEVVALKRQQAQDRKALMDEISRRVGEVQSDQIDLSASQGEVQTQAETISAEVSRIGAQAASAERQITELSNRVKDLQNNQAIGLGSLSKRLDERGEALTVSQDTQSKKLEKFAAEVSTQVDQTATQVAKLAKSVEALAAQDKKQAQSVAELAKKLDTLGTKLTGEISSQRDDGGGADAAEVAALKKRVDFLGDRLPKEVDSQGKRLAAVEKSLKDIQELLADLHGRLKALEGR
jgi:chromosome segregation ATPase